MDIDYVKEYLKIDYEDDDEKLENLILVSEIYIESCVGNAYKTNEKALKLANVLQLKLISDMYENCGTTINSNTKRDIIVTTILDKLSNLGE
ncbi:MAG: head-tail connector protein [Sarcina sp.]